MRQMILWKMKKRITRKTLSGSEREQKPKADPLLYNTAYTAGHINSLKERVGAVKQSRSEQFLGLYSFIGGTGMFSILAHTIPNSS